MASVAIDVLLSGIRDTSGNPLAAGLVYTYEPGTTTPRSLYTDSGLITPAANPVVLDAYGMATVYANNSYKFVVKTSGGTTLYTWDNLTLTAPVGGDFPNGGNPGAANRTLGNTDNYSLGLLTNNSNRLHITNAGDIGIGTTSPSMQLDIVDNTSSGSGGLKISTSANNIPTAIDLYSNASNANCRNWRIVANATDGSLSYIRSTTTGGTPAETIMELNSSGNIGLGGVASTDDKVRAYGNTDGLVQITTQNDSTGASAISRVGAGNLSSNTYLEHLSNGYVGTGARSAGFGVLTTSAPHGLSITAENSNAVGVIKFYTGGNAAANLRMTISATGSVGIGLTPTSNMSGLSVESGLLTIKETTTPTADTDYGKIYTKSDNKLYFQDGAGVEHTVAFV